MTTSLAILEASDNIKAFITTKGDMSVGIEPIITHVDTFMTYDDLGGELNQVREEVREKLRDTFSWLYNDTVYVSFEFEED